MQDVVDDDVGAVADEDHRRRALLLLLLLQPPPPQLILLLFAQPQLPSFVTEDKLFAMDSVFPVLEERADDG
jgi:hypothetical protein